MTFSDLHFGYYLVKIYKNDLPYTALGNFFDFKYKVA